MSLEIQTASLFTASLGSNQYLILRDNTDTGAIRMKSLHIDMVFSPLASADRPVGVQCHLHRVHNNVPNANLSLAEGSRVKYEILTVGRLTDRYYRMWLKEINLEFGYHLILVINAFNVTGGNPSAGVAAKWWELTTDPA